MSEAISGQLSASGTGSHPIVAGSANSIIAYRGTRPVTRAQFLADVAAAAARLPDRRHVINVCNDRYLFLVGFAAALARGQISLLPPSRVTGVVVAIAEDYGDCYLLADTHVGDGALPLYCLTLETTAAAPSAATTEAVAIPLQRTAAIVFTSGSTGKATPNIKTWRGLVEGAQINAAALLQGREAGAAAVTLVATVPQQHMYGLETTVMLPLMGACAAQCDRPFFPADVLAALERTPMPRILVTTPIHLRALADSGAGAPALTEIWSATAPLNPELAADCERRFAAPLREILGSSETGTFATRCTARDEPWRLVDGFSLTPSGDGITISAAHLGSSAELQDSVEMLGARSFRLLGRTRDLVNIAGKRASLGDLNARLLSIPGVRDGIIFLPAEPAGNPGTGAPVRTAAMVVAPGLTARQVLAALRTLIDPAFLPRPLLLVEALPRNETSKLPRSALLALFAEHVNAS